MRIVVVGASHAGVAFADAMRRNGFEGEVTMIDRLDGTPLERPPLSKAFLLAGDDGDDGFALRAPAWFADRQITLLCGREAAQIDVGGHRVTLADGAVLEYDRLVLATGAVPRPFPGAEDLDGVFLLRNPEDAMRLREASRSTRSALVVGGGYIGLEVAASLTKAGKAVTVIEAAPRLLSRVASPPISSFFAGLHGEAGVEVLTGSSVTEIRHWDSSFIGATLANGREIDADMMVVGIGVTPETGLATGADLEIGNGILVDGDMRTSAVDIYAIGDGALDRSAWHGSRIESVHNAQETAERAAAAILGHAPPDRQAPWFWSDQYDVKLQSAGLLPTEGTKLRHIRREGRREGGFSIWSFTDTELVAVEAIRDPSAYVLGKSCLESGRLPSPAQLSDADFDLKSFVADKSVA